MLKLRAAVLKEIEGFPIFKCEEVNEGRMRFWCPFCRDFHNHGNTQEIGHRTSHCTSDLGRAAMPKGYFVCRG